MPSWEHLCVMSAIPKPVEREEVRELLEDVRDFICRYVVVSARQADAVALWVLHTHAFSAAETTPYLEISSAEKQSGKTRLLETLELLVAEPWLTGRISISALARKVDVDQPTLLLDESDALFAGDKAHSEELRGVLNAGFRRGGKSTINVATGQNGWTPTDFSVFCAKAIAGLGALPDTLASRSIAIRLRRRRNDEEVEKFRYRRAKELAQPLRERLEHLVPPCVEALVEITDAEPSMPPGLSDRSEDVWEPLIAIADLAGGDWSQRARAAAVELAAATTESETSIGVRLLSDIQAIFHERGVAEISSTELVYALCAREESPWETWGYGRGLTPHALARQLKQFDIRPRHMSDGTARGYALSQFEDAFSRYLVPDTEEIVKPSNDVAAPPWAAELPTKRSDALTVAAADGGVTAAADARPEPTAALSDASDDYADAEYRRLTEKFPEFRGDEE
jgi:Protein of unknown function (DUF3631)